jgi:hypothetical protein
MNTDTLYNFNYKIKFSNNNASNVTPIDVPVIKPIDFGTEFFCGLENNEFQLKFGYSTGFPNLGNTTYEFKNAAFFITAAYLIPWKNL